MPTPTRGNQWRTTLLVSALLAGAAVLPADAREPLAGARTLQAHVRGGEVIRLGQVVFEPRADGLTGFRLDLDVRQLTDHFLSMKEFKCIGGEVELACHVPYPYRQPGTVQDRAEQPDYAWLEHALLFIYKKPGEFSAKLWNGLYYRLQRTERGLEGLPQAIDLNRISAPPDDLSRPPYRAALRDDVAPGSRWIERLTIE